LNGTNGSYKHENNIFNSEYPNRKDLHVDATEIPICYKEAFNINNLTRQFDFGNSEYIIKNQFHYKNTDTSFVQTPVPLHINLYKQSLI
jgi:hypothetical protein